MRCRRRCAAGRIRRRSCSRRAGSSRRWTLKRTRPVSTHGLTTITFPPRRLKWARVVIIRGWLEAGLAPMMNTTSSLSRSSQSSTRGGARSGMLPGRHRCLVAVVGAVVDVVGAVDPGQWEEKPGLVRSIGRWRRRTTRRARWRAAAGRCAPGPRPRRWPVATIERARVERFGQPPEASSSRGESLRADRCRCAEEAGLIAPCMSADIAWIDFLQTSGKWPFSLTMPPSCPPMPRAQVLQAFFERRAR